MAPNGGYGFGPRHLDFHPTEPWVYVSLERQNRLDMFAFHDTTLLAAAVFQKGTLAEPGNIRGRQAVGTVHVHPNGRFVYVANRASSTTEVDGQRVFKEIPHPEERRRRVSKKNARDADAVLQSCMCQVGYDA